MAAAPSSENQETSIYTADRETAAKPEMESRQEETSDDAAEQIETEQPAASTEPSDTDLSGWPAPETSETRHDDINPESSHTGWDTTEPESDHGLHDSGPSEWEGWSPTPSPESAVHPYDDNESLQEIRELVGTLQQRLDRLADPLPVGARGIDADELADQLSGWASGGPDSGELLEVIREARANPRDIDAVTRLAARAEELERLVERYGTICSDAQRWVARLRYPDSSNGA
ncbi:MAG TPA: hypothetical protein VGR22_10715 [Thermomicrobiales bacterium]|nr:hypothetical protein [Thermomicrobiales bacterium]